MEKPRSADILTLVDEDFELIGIDPNQITPEAFEQIVDHLREYYNEGFSDRLSEFCACINAGEETPAFKN